jgi:hypothetical protein
VWLKLDLDGIDFHFRIKNYRQSTENWDDEWSKEDLTLQSSNWLDYHIDNDELLLMCEVEELRDDIKSLLFDENKKIYSLECIEPDLTFTFYPKIDLREESNYIYVQRGCEIVDVFMELKVAFWNDGLTANRLLLNFDRSDLEKLLCYLELITGKISIQDKQVQKLIEQGSIYGYA